MTKKTIDSGVLAVLYESDDGEAHEGWTRVGRQHIRTARWFEEYFLVVTDGTGFWGAGYNEGLTEEQESERPWEHAETVNLVRLFPHEVTHTEYSTTPVGATA